MIARDAQETWMRWALESIRNNESAGRGQAE
jgi:hypothetical protein